MTRTLFETPALPPPRGPISESVTAALKRRPGRALVTPEIDGNALDDDDLHIALYVCYELHYRGWTDVDPSWEWDSELVRVRGTLEGAFRSAVERAVAVPHVPTAESVTTALRTMVDQATGPSVSSFIEERGTLEQLRELAIHRSAYQLKEADPHTWAIPRLPAGRAKAAMLGLQFDEYGNGQPGASHAELFATTMRALDLDPTYGRYIDVIPGVTLATVNLLTMFGLHRELVAACLGHLAVFEMTSVVPMRRYGAAMRRLTGGDAGAAFYDVHVVADTEHERVAIEELVPGLLDLDPTLGHDIVFGAAALMALEQRLAEHLMQRWAAGRSSLRVVDTALRRAS